MLHATKSYTNPIQYHTTDAGTPHLFSPSLRHHLVHLFLETKSSETKFLIVKPTKVTVSPSFYIHTCTKRSQVYDILFQYFKASSVCTVVRKVRSLSIDWLWQTASQCKNNKGVLDWSKSNCWSSLMYVLLLRSVFKSGLINNWLAECD